MKHDLSAIHNSTNPPFPREAQRSRISFPFTYFIYIRLSLLLSFFKRKKEKNIAKTRAKRRAKYKATQRPRRRRRHRIVHRGRKSSPSSLLEI